jgi:hypothetical protein
MPQSTAVRPGNQRRTDAAAAGPEHHRHVENAREALARQDGTGPAMRFVVMWKRAVRRAEERLVVSGCALALLDVVTALSACFAPLLTTLLGVARLAGFIVFVPAVLRALAIQHAEREDAELLQAIAVAVGVAALYFALRTYFVVAVCSL